MKTSIKTIEIEKIVIDLKTKERKTFKAWVSNEQNKEFHTYTLTYEGYRTDWQEVA